MAFDIQTGTNSGEDQGVLSEHESGNQNKSKENVEAFKPTPEQEKLIKMVEKTFAKHKKHRSKYDKEWLDNYKMFRGDQWKNKRPSYRHSEVVNLVFQTIQSTVPMQTDARPKFEFLAQEPSDQPLSEVLNDISSADWEKHNWLYVLLEMLYDSHFYGTAYGRVDFDKKALDGLGAPVFESEDPFYMYPDPEAREINDEGRRSRKFIKAEPRDIEYLKRKHPKFAKYFKADLMDFSVIDRTLKTDDSAFESPVSDVSLLEGSDQFSQGSGDQALEITLYMKDDTVVKVKEQQEVDTGQVDVQGQPIMGVQEVEVKKLKYPKGRKIVLVNRIPVIDEEMEFDHRKFPFIKLNNYILPREFYGISEVEQLKGPQRIFNKMVSFALDVMTLMGNPVWIVDQDSGINTDDIINKPGAILEPVRGSRVERSEGAQLQPYVLQMIDRFKSWFDDVAGVNDVSRGAADGVTAARAIEALQEAANTRVRQKTRLLDKVLNEFGHLYLSNVFQYYTAPRVFRLTADDETQRFFKASMGDGAMSVTPFNEEGKQQEPLEFETVRDFDIKVTTGSSLTIAKRDTFNKAVSLFDRQAIDVEDLLEAAEWPNIPKTMERMRKRQEAQFEQQQAAQAQQVNEQSGLQAEQGQIQAQIAQQKQV